LFDRLKRLEIPFAEREAVFWSQVADLFDQRQGRRQPWLELEELLIRADIGFETTPPFSTKSKLRSNASGRIRRRPPEQSLKDPVGIIRLGGTDRRHSSVDGKLTMVLVVASTGSA